MLAVIMTGGKQYKVSQDMVLNIDKLPSKVGDQVVFKDVLLVQDGDKVLLGGDAQGYQVEAVIVADVRAKKINVVKFKRRKRYLRNLGHRQQHTQIKITGIKGIKKAAKAKSEKSKAKSEE